MDKMKILILTAENSKKVFRMDQERLDAALARHPAVGSLASFTICRTSVSFEDEPGWNEEDYAMFYRMVADKDAIIGYMFPLETFREKAPHVRYIHIIGAGVEHLFPLTWLPEQTLLTNSRGAHGPKTCEYAMMAMLMLGNDMPRLYTAQRESRWDGHFLTVVEGKTVLIVGCGKQGTAVAKAAGRLGLRAVGVDPDVSARDGFVKIVHPDALCQVLPEADQVFLTLPSTKETYHFFGAEQFAAMKDGAGLVNICRGKVLDTDAMLTALDQGKLSGAILDVYEQEPLPEDHPLWTAKNVIMTPHMGCDDEDNYISRCFDIFFENLIRMAKGQEPDNLVDRTLGY